MLDPRTRAERRFPLPNGTRAETGGVFSPDGTTIAFVRYYTDATWQLIVAPADGSEEGQPVGTRSPGTAQSDNAGVEFDDLHAGWHGA